MAVNEKLKLLGTFVRMQIGGHAVTVLITDYNLSNDSYHGELHRNISMNTGEKTPVVQSVHGIKMYPFEPQPKYAFQAVRCGEDEQPLLDIAQFNADNSRGTPDPGPHVWVDLDPPAPKVPVVPEKPRTPAPEQVATGALDPADKNKDGRVTNEERKSYKRDHPEG